MSTTTLTPETSPSEGTHESVDGMPKGYDTSEMYRGHLIQLHVTPMLIDVKFDIGCTGCTITRSPEQSDIEFLNESRSLAHQHLDDLLALDEAFAGIAEAEASGPLDVDDEPSAGETVYLNGCEKLLPSSVDTEPADVSTGLVDTSESTPGELEGYPLGDGVSMLDRTTATAKLAVSLLRQVHGEDTRKFADALSDLYEVDPGLFGLTAEPDVSPSGCAHLHVSGENTARRGEATYEDALADIIVAVADKFYREGRITV